MLTDREVIFSGLAEGGAGFGEDMGNGAWLEANSAVGADGEAAVPVGDAVHKVSSKLIGRLVVQGLALQRSLLPAPPQRTPLAVPVHSLRTPREEFESATFVTSVM